jgi:predicted 3-demethylubiquinone-9 3-methyltransferase (glyoxalase superfamily)
LWTWRGFPVAFATPAAFPANHLGRLRITGNRPTKISAPDVELAFPRSSSGSSLVCPFADLAPRHRIRRMPAHLNPTRTSLMTSITPFLWLDNNVPEAVAFYKSVFPNAKVDTVNDFMASFELEGQKFNALNGGPKYKFNEAISFFISVETQEEVDYFWSRLIADGGEESRCGWLKDKFGLSWQVVPTALGRYLSDPDRKKADRAMQAMMKMRKIVIADLDKAYNG